MVDRKKLNEMSQIDIRQVSKTELIDICSIELDIYEPVSTRMTNLMDCIKNPYCFRVGNIPVRVRFTDEGKTLDETLENHLKI